MTLGGEVKANGRDPKSCLDRDSNFKLGCFVVMRVVLGTYACPHLELKLSLGFVLLSKVCHAVSKEIKLANVRIMKCCEGCCARLLWLLM
jgi:hypothetical protein